MSCLKSIFPNGFVIPIAPPVLDPESQVRAHMSDHGIQPPDSIIFDGKMHRFATSQKKGDKSGWYVLFDGDIRAGAYGCWREMIDQHWREDIGRDLSFAERLQHSTRINEIKKQKETELAETRESASIRAAQIWDAAQVASDDHPYLQRKGITNPGLRVASDGRLVAPMYSQGDISSLQYIGDDGSKLFLKGGKTGGAYWCIGGDYTAGDGRIYIAEGVATAASIFEVTGKPVIVSYSAGNLLSVAQTVRGDVGAMREILIVADNDSSGTGRRESDKAALAIGGSVIMPPIIGDANDFVASGGDLLGLLEPQLTPVNDDDYLVHADNFSSQPAPISWLIKGWLQDKGLIMVHGPSGGGKTFVVLDWCLHVASDLGEWSGKRVKNGPVVYLAGEGNHGLRGRVAAWKHHKGVSRLNMWLSKAGVDLNTAPGYLRVKKAIDALEVKPKLIVVDTLHRFLSGDENSATDAKTMLDACGGLMLEYGCSVLLVHHTGVSEDAQGRARGSSAWRGALENEISIVPGKDGKPLEIAYRKAKDAEMPPSLFGNLSSVNIPGWFDDDGDQVSSAVLTLCDAPEVYVKEKLDPLYLLRKDLYSIWDSIGKDTRRGNPFISNSVLIKYFEDSGRTPKAAENIVYGKGKDSKTGDLFQLQESGRAEKVEGGWILTDGDNHAASNLLNK